MTTPNNQNLLNMIRACVTNILSRQELFYTLISMRGYTDILDLISVTLIQK